MRRQMASTIHAAHQHSEFIYIDHKFSKAHPDPGGDLAGVDILFAGLQEEGMHSLTE